jgi:hypothetical protein
MAICSRLILTLFCLSSCIASSAVYLAKNRHLSIENGLKGIYLRNLQILTSPAALLTNNLPTIQYFFHANDKIVPEIVAPGAKVNIYFYKRAQGQAPAPILDAMENLSSFDLVFTDSMEDLQKFLKEANPILIKLASESKYVPLIRILKPTDNFIQKVSGIANRIEWEMPFKDYVVEALPVFKTKSISIEPRVSVDSGTSSENVAVIFESAVHPALELCVRNVMYYLKSNWSLIIYHSRENEMFIKSALSDLKNVEYRIPQNQIYSVAEYNQYMLNADFYKSLNAKKVLIFQTDSIMLKEGMNQFMKYDYAGAPWPCMKRAGNGGFSLRTVDVMIEACLKSRTVRENEDLYFSRFVSSNRKYKLVPYHEAYAFSRELQNPTLNHMSVEGGKLDGHMALHQTWHYSSPTILKQILNHSLQKLKNETI